MLVIGLLFSFFTYFLPTATVDTLDWPITEFELPKFELNKFEPHLNELTELARYESEPI